MKFHESLNPFLQRHKISVLAVLNSEGAPHAATMHYAWDPQTGSFVFFTRSTTMKYAALKDGPKKASMVIGFSDEEFCTLQMRGEAMMCQSDHLKQVYCEKFRHILDFLRKEDTAFLEFTPNWYRFTDMKPEKPLKISSED